MVNQLVNYKIGLDARKIKDFGIGTYIQNLLTWAEKISFKNKFYLIFNIENIDLFNEIAKVQRIYLIPTNIKNYSFQEHLILSHIINKLGLDLYHSPHYVLPVFVKTKCIITLHDIIHLTYPEHGLIQKLTAYILMKLSINKANMIITVSESSLVDIIKHFPQAKNKIIKIYNGVSEIFFQKFKEEEKNKIINKYNLPNKYILYVGNHLRHKNIERLIGAYKIINQKERDINLVLVGKFKSKILKEIKDPSVLEKIHVISYVGQKDLKAIYEKALILVLPSLYEGFGLPALEALACGTPIACSELKVFKEIIGDLPIYFNPLSEKEISERILKIINDEKIKNYIIEQGYKIASKYQWERSCSEHFEVYFKLLNLK